MLITRKSLASGIERTRKLDIDPEAYAKWESGELLIQKAFPHLSPDDREFILTGCTAEEWDEMTRVDDDDFEGVDNNV